MDRSITHGILLINLIVAVIFYLRRKNEVPFFIALFNMIVEYRIVALDSGVSTFITYNYGIDFKFNMEYAYIASDLILLGSCIMLYCFIIFHRPAEKTIKDNNEMLKTFVTKSKTQIILGLCFFSAVSIVLGGRNDAGSYSLLIKIANSSFIIMLYLIIFFSKTKALLIKLTYGGVFLFLGYLTYSNSIRFQFLAWIIPIGYFIVRNVKPGRKIILSIVGLFFILIVFSLAGASRGTDIGGLTTQQKYEVGMQRIVAADDVNFIDGFMMIYQVYPKLLDYDYGIEHLAVFFRPIPRSWWPGKPLASWVRNYQAKYTGKVLESAGFSPTIWGVFYSEGGTFGVVIFSVFWAWMLNYLYRKFSAFNSDLSVILVGILLVSLIPVFRSGDLAGDLAIVLMSFWPIMLFVKYYKKFIKAELRKERLKQLVV